MSGYKVFLDSNIFIYFLEKNEHFFARASRYFRAAENHKIRILTSTLTYFEVLVPLAGAGREYLRSQYDYLFKGTDFIEVVQVSFDAAEIAAELRCRHKLKAPDALQIGCALSSEAKEFVTGDSRLAKLKVRGLEIVKI